MPVDDGFKVFVGDLPGDVAQEELQTVFGTYGEVKSIHLMAPHARTGQRCALLFYAKQESAEDAIKVLNGIYKIREDAENPIKVAWAKEKHAAGGDGAGAGRTADTDGYKLFVGGLPVDCKDDELKMVFQTYGDVNKIHIMPAKDGQNRVAAFVFYAKAESGDDAIAVLNEQYKIRTDAEMPIQVRWAAAKDKGAGKGGDWNAWGGGGDWNSWGGGASSGKGWSGEPQKIQAPEGWKLFVGGLPQDCSDEELRSVFSTYGTLGKVHVMPPHAMSGRVAAFVYYEDDKAGDDAIKVLNGIYKIREDAEAPIQVRWATDNKQDKGCGKGCGGWGGGDSYSSWGGGKGGGKCGGKQALGWQGNSGWGGDGGWGGKGGNSWGGGGSWKGDSWKGGSSWNDGGWGGKGGGKDSWSQGGGWGGKDSGKGGKGGKGGGKDMSDTKLFVGNLPDDVTEDALSYVFQTYGKVQQIHVMRGKSRTGAACAFVELSSPGEAETAIVTLNDKYEIKPGYGPIMVKKANAGQRSNPY